MSSSSGSAKFGRDDAGGVAYASVAANNALDTICRVQFEAFLASRERLVFSPFEPALISVVIVLYNQAHLSFACLKSLVDQQNVGIEVIIIDNASSDQTSQLISRIHGARIERNRQNLHFIEAANQGASFARGENILFLNNDVILLSSALSAAVGVLRNEPRVGAVGAKLIRADGKLQEAGSEIFSDGTTVGRLLGADPFDPSLHSRTDVDYCSGAFLLTPRELFLDLRMFDTAYKPAYYEDVDYCVRLQEYGYRVLYDPKVAAVHLQHGSSESTASAQALMLKNRELFVKRHSSYLSKKRQGASIITPSTKRHILMLDDFLPDPAMGQGQPRTMRILETIGKLNYQVTLIALNDSSDSDISRLTRAFPFVAVAKRMPTTSLGNFLQVEYEQFSHIFVSRPTNMETLQTIRSSDPGLFRSIKIIYDAEAVFALRDIGRRSVLDRVEFTQAQIDQIVQIEIALARSADYVLTVSNSEFIRFAALGSHNIFKLSHVVKCAVEVAGFEQRQGIISLGPLIDVNAPNFDAAKWFVDEVMRYMPGQLIDAGVEFGGLIDRTLESMLARPGFRCVGLVQDAASFYAKARVFVAAQRFGAGIPLKVVEAAAAGVPCVVSGLVAEQLGWREGVEYLVGRDAKEFAKQVTLLHSNFQLWREVQQAAQERVRNDFNQDSFDQTLKNILLV